MRKYISASFILCLLILCFTVYPVFAANSDNKKGCDAFSQPDIQDILNNINASNGKVLHIKKTPLAGICEVAHTDNGGQMRIFYFDIAKTHLMLGNLLEVKTMTNLTAKSAMETQDKKRIDTSKIPLTSALVLGDLKAKKKVIIFTDPDSPYSSNLHKTVKQINDKRRDIVFYIKMYPLELNKEAYWKSKSIVCKNSLQLLQDCFDKKEIAKTDCKTDEVDNTIKLAKSLGIPAGMPVTILPDGRWRMGVIPEEVLTNLIDGKI
jgi:thiol:disulfide interchange protein DsbC